MERGGVWYIPLKQVGVLPLRGPPASAMLAIRRKIAITAIRCDDSHGMERGLHFAVIPLHAASQLVSAFERFDSRKEDVKCLPV